jgi:putative ABC transport system permease protein
VRWSNVPHLYLTRLRITLVPELLAAIGIAVGVALLFASNVAGKSLDDSVARLSGSLLGSMRLQVSARSPQGFDERLLARVRALQGVTVAAPVLDEEVEIAGPSGAQAIDLIGSEPRFARLGSAVLRRFTTEQLARIDALALPAASAHAIGVGALQPVTVEADGRRQQALVGVELTSSDSPLLASSPIAIAPLSYAQQLTGLRGRLTRIFVAVQRGREAEVRRELVALAGDRLDVRSAAVDAALFAQAAGPIDQSTQLFSAISALVGLLFAFYAMLLTVPHRRGLVYDLRITGYSSLQVAQVLAFDALALGLLASALGLGLGELLSSSIFHVSPGYLSFAFPVGTQRIVTAGDVAVAVAAAMLIALAGVFAPMRDIFGPFTLRAMPAPPRRSRSGLRLALGGACIALAGAILALSPQLALLGVASLTLALLTLLPSVFDLAVAAFDRGGAAVIGTAQALAAMELHDRGNRLRSLAIAVTGAIAVFGSVAVGSAQRNLQRGLDRTSREISGIADVWLLPTGSYDELGTAPFAPLQARRLSAIRDVAHLSPYFGSFLDVGQRRVWVLAPPLDGGQLLPPSPLVEGRREQASRRLAIGGWLVISAGLASLRHLRIGSAFTLPSPQPITFRVAAVSTNLGWAPGAIVLNPRDYVRAWASSYPSAYALRLRPHVSAVVVAAEVRRALGPESGLTVETAQRREAVQRATSRRGLQRLSEISTLVLLAAVFAMAAAMATVIWQRRPQLAHMQVDGFERSLLWRALLLETAVLLGSGCCLGAIFGVGGQLLLSRALAKVTGFPVVLSANGLTAAASFLLVTCVAVAIVAIPGHLAARVRPAVAFED